MERTYRINQFEKVTGVSAHTLRFFDKIGLLSPARSENGYRVYSLEQVSIAEMIPVAEGDVLKRRDQGNPERL